MDLKSFMRNAASEVTNRSERQLREVEKRAKAEGKNLNDKYYDQKARVEEMRRKGY